MRRSATIRFAVVAALLVLVAPIGAPQLLAFPYRAKSNGSEVWSEAPLPQAALDTVIGRAAALTRQSPLAAAVEPRHVFLTQGGWRWRWLTLTSQGAFGLTRPLNEAIVVNRNDVTTDHVWNGAAIGGARTLSGVIAHETCHGLERRHFGFAVDWTTPAWLREGYCDHVAKESSLSKADAARLRAANQSHPALAYYNGRRRVAATLAGNGGNVDALFTAR